MTLRFFKQTKWIEVYFEVREKRTLARFFDKQRDGRDHEYWLGRCYLTFHVYDRQKKAAAMATSGGAE